MAQAVVASLRRDGGSAAPLLARRDRGVVSGPRGASTMESYSSAVGQDSQDALQKRGDAPTSDHSPRERLPDLHLNHENGPEPPCTSGTWCQETQRRGKPPVRRVWTVPRRQDLNS